MINYRHNAQNGTNPFTSDRFWGVGMPGRLAPVQTTSEGIQSYPNVVPILTQVVEWPFDEDDAGVPFDAGDIWGVRTRCLLESGGGEIDWWTAVPRVLPEGYTPVGRHGRIVPFIDDHLGDNPFVGRVRNPYGYGDEIWPVRWRTPTGQYPSDLTDDGYLWVPMNLNQQTVDASYINGPTFTESSSSGLASGIGPIGFPPICVIPYTAGPNPYLDWGYNSVGEHVGFRGGKLVLFALHTGFCAPAYAGFLRVVIGWDDATPATDALPPNIEYDESFSVGDLSLTSAVAYNWRWDLEVMLPALLSPLGTRKHWIVFVGSCQAGDALVDVSGIFLSPRTDIPLWYWSSTRNRIAPGGVVL
jgi:hypothetical protein